MRIDLYAASTSGTNLTTEAGTSVHATLEHVSGRSSNGSLAACTVRTTLA